jgi:Sugar-transfer associated ATP-grasp
MNFISTTRAMSGRHTAFLVVVCFAYAAVSLLAQMEFPTWGDSEFSPVEMALWLAIFAGAMGTIAKLSASDVSGNRRRYWTLATIAVVSISVLESVDWFADTQHIWQSAGYESLSNSIKAILAITIAAALVWSTRLPKEYVWGVRCLQATVILQFLSILFETTRSGQILGYSFLVPKFSFPTEFAELLSMELYIISVALADSSKRPFLTAQMLHNSGAGGLFVGANARRVYRDRNLFRYAKYPPVAIAFYPVFREIFLFSAIVWLVLTTGRVVKNTNGKPLFAQAKEMTLLWFNQRIDPPSYYAQEFHKVAKLEAAPHYLTPYETKNGLFAALNNQLPNPLPGHEMSNKELFADCCSRFDIPHPQKLLTVNSDGVTWHCKPHEIENDLFCKPQFGMGAVGTFAFRYRPPGIYINLENKEFDLQAMLQMLQRRTPQFLTIVQPWLKNHSSISDLALDSLITFRVVTCKDEAGRPEVTHAMLRVLVKLEPEWSSVRDDEYAAPIDIETGELGLMTGDSIRTAHLRYEYHIVTGSKIYRRTILAWPQIRDLAMKAHEAFAHRMVVGWDIALTEQGPVLLEGNTNMDVMFLQRVHNEPIGQSRLGALMNFHLKNLYGSGMTVWYS